MSKHDRQLSVPSSEVPIVCTRVNIKITLGQTTALQTIGVLKVLQAQSCMLPRVWQFLVVKSPPTCKQRGFVYDNGVHTW